MRIVMLGPQGAGKGTQAERLVAQTGAQHIATGDLVRSEISAGTPIGRQVKSYNDRGELVPDDLIVRLVGPHLQGDNWILDGFPRDEPQAQILDEYLQTRDTKLDAVILLDAPDAVLVRRLLDRVQSQATGKIYNLSSNPPPSSDPGPFVRRVDDTPEDIQRRLELYHHETEPLRTYYGHRGLLHVVNANQPVNAVASDIARNLNQAIPHTS